MEKYNPAKAAGVLRALGAEFKARTPVTEKLGVQRLRVSGGELQLDHPNESAVLCDEKGNRIFSKTGDRPIERIL